MVRQAAQNTATQAGDGTTTSVVLTEAIIDAADEYMKAGANVTDVCRSIVDISKQIDKQLVKKAKKLDSKTLRDVARISSNNDQEIGDLIADTYAEASFVTAENSMDWSTYTEVSKGVKISRGYSNRAFINDHRTQQCVLTDAYVLITDYEITSLQHMENILRFVIEQNRSLLIIGQLNVQTMGTILTNVLAGKIKVCNIIPPDMGIRKDDLMEDLAVVLGGKYVSGRNGDNLQVLEPAHLGKAARIVVSADGTVITPTEHFSEVDTHIANLKSLIETTKNSAERDFINHRIANISGSIGVIYVGGNSDIEQKEKKDRVDDAVLAVRAALEEGILPGAGQTLIDAFKYVKQPDAIKEYSESYAIAYEVMQQAITIPFVQILLNAGKDPVKVATEIELKAKDGYGYDSKNDKYGDLIKMGVIDPAKVTRSALKNSVSVATTIIMSDASITNIRDYAGTR
jgi:chaperonin GroEL